MKTRIFRSYPLAVALALGLVFTGQSAFANNSKNVKNEKKEKAEVIVIGDSLSDTGNLFDLTGWFPPEPYWKGRFSNGRVWAEYFSKRLHVPLDSRAYGGAFTGVWDVPVALPDGTYTFLPFTNLDNLQYPGVFEPLPGLTEEVDELLADHPKGLNPRALYVVWAGANDFFLGLALGGAPADMVPLLQGAVENVAATVCRLGEEGARHFAVANLPDIGQTPFGLSFGPEGSAGLSSLSSLFNQGLAAALDALPKKCADTMVVLDAFGALTELITDPPEDLDNVTVPCKDNSEVDCGSSLFFDDVHPTTLGHSLLTDRFLDAFCGADEEHGRGKKHRRGHDAPDEWKHLCARAE